MRLGVNLGLCTSASELTSAVTVAQHADRLGYDSVWVAEAYGSDAATVIGHLAASTDRIGLGAGVFQIPARTPAMTAMTAATLDILSGHRFRLGLGVSGPQVSQGWHGEPFERPLGRSREYVSIVRRALTRETVTADGPRYRLPADDGKPLRLALRGHRPDLPVYLAAVGPKNLALAGEIADGWLGIFCAPAQLSDQVATIRSARPDPAAPFDVVVGAPTVIGDDPEQCADAVRAYAALYVGGMGSREQNFYNAQAVRLGFADAARACQDAYLAGNIREAMASLPWEFLDAVSLLGPVDRVAARIRAYGAAGATTLSATLFGDLEQRVGTLEAMRSAAEIADAVEEPDADSPAGPTRAQ